MSRRKITEVGRREKAKDEEFLLEAISVGQSSITTPVKK